MLNVSIRVADIGELHTGTRALTTGGIDTEVLAIPVARRGTAFWRPRRTIALQVDRRSLWRYRLYAVVRPISSLLIAAIAAATAIGFATGFAARFSYTLIMGAFLSGLLLALVEEVARPRLYPTLEDETMVRLRGVDPDAAREWQAANRSDMIILEPGGERSSPRFLFGTRVLFIGGMLHGGLAMWCASTVFHSGTPVEEWSILYPIGFTLAWVIVLADAVRMLLFWLRVPAGQRPRKPTSLPEFAHLTANDVGTSAFALFLAGFMAVVLWVLWAQAQAL